MDFNYILDEKGNPIPEDDYQKWARWMFENENNRKIAITNMNNYVISTVFLGVEDNSYLFETWIFNPQGTDPINNDHLKYRTKKAALRGHLKAENKVRRRTIVLVN